MKERAIDVCLTLPGVGRRHCEETATDTGKAAAKAAVSSNACTCQPVTAGRHLLPLPPRTRNSPLTGAASPQRRARRQHRSGTGARAPDPAPSTAFPSVTFGVVSFLQYQRRAARIERIQRVRRDARLSQHPGAGSRIASACASLPTCGRRPTPASIRNLALRLEYASLDVQVTDNIAIMFGLHEMPWLAFEETVNRYRVVGPFFSERLGLIPGTTDLGVSLKRSTEPHRVPRRRVYNGEGQGRAEIDKYKSIDGRATFRPFSQDSELGKVTISGFYQYGWYARDRPRNVAIAMGSYENDNIVLTAQYLSATDNPFVAVDIERRGFSFFGEGRQGLTGWAGIGGLDLLRSGRFERQRLPATPHRGRCALEPDLTRALGCRRFARADPSDVQLTTARAPAARSDPHRVLSSLKHASRAVRRGEVRKCDGAVRRSERPACLRTDRRTS